MRPLIQTPDDVARLRAEADSWVGTPWIMNGAIKGYGVSCHRGPSEVLRAIGHVHPDVPGPRVAIKQGFTAAMVDWLDAAAPHFERVFDGLYKPGDVLVMDTGIGHIALVVDCNMAMHTWKDGGTQIQHYGATASRVVGAWRPMVE